MHVGGCVLLVVVTSCYRPSTAVDACHARCDPAIGDCPDPLTCGSDGVCRDPNNPTMCPSPDGPDGGKPAGGPNIMFVTSAAYQVGMLGGVDAADAKCREAALGNFDGTFVAYLAAKGVAATDRLGTASGWVRPDTRPFANSVQDIIDGKILYPPRIDDKGVDRGNDNIVVGTGARANGTQSANCNDYTGTGSITTGFPDAGMTGWSEGAFAGCGSNIHLYCFQIDFTSSVTVGAVAGKRAFVSATNLQPSNNPMGTITADKQCHDEAIANGFGTTFVALIATTTESAAAHAGGTGPWFRKDGVSIGTLDNPAAPLDQNSAGEYVAGEAWFGGPDETVVGTTSSTCANWIGGAGNNGIVGDMTRSRRTPFLDANTRVCTLVASVRCVEK